LEVRGDRPLDDEGLLLMRGEGYEPYPAHPPTGPGPITGPTLTMASFGMELAGILGWLISGLIVGAIARLVVKGPHNLGCLGTSMLGILGSIVGGTLFNALAGNRFALETSGFIGAVFGAVALLVIGRLVSGQNRSRPPARR